MNLRLFFSVALVFLAGISAGAEDYSELFEEAIETIDWEFGQEWAFTETSLRDDGLFVGHFDPRLEEGERWSLISVDRRQPTEKEAKKYAHDKADHGDSSESRTTGIVGSDSLELLEETDDYWLFTFVPDDDEVAFTDSFDAEVKIIKAGHYVESIDIRNHSDIKPGFGTKISRFVMQLEFGPAAEDGPIVPLSINVHVTGRALLFIGFDETDATRYSDFEHIAE